MKLTLTYPGRLQGKITLSELTLQVKVQKIAKAAEQAYPVSNAFSFEIRSNASLIALLQGAAVIKAGIKIISLKQ